MRRLWPARGSSHSRSFSSPAPRRARRACISCRVAHFSAPVYATSAPGEPANLYVVEQAGRILVLTNGHIRSAPFLDIRSQVRSGGEQGLLSVAFAPDYAQSHRFYVDYTDSNGDTRVVQYRSNGTSAILSSAKQLLFVKDFASNHNGGQLQFGPDKRLYWGNGDGGGGGDPQHNGQSLARPFAKIMRLNIDAAKPRWETRRLRPAQPVALLLRPGDRRSLHRRRRPGRVGGDRLPAQGAPAARTSAGTATRAGTSYDPSTKLLDARRLPRADRGVPAFARAARSPAATSIAARKVKAAWGGTSTATTARATSGA